MSFYQFLVILNARKKIALVTLFFIVMLMLLISLFWPKSYEASSVIIVNSTGTDSVTGNRLPAQLIPGYMATQIDIIRSQKVALKVVENLSLFSNSALVEAYYESTAGKGEIRTWLADWLLGNLTVRPSRESSVFALSYESGNPEFSAMLANAFAEAYIKTNLELKIEPSKRTTAWFTMQVEGIRYDLIKAQKRLSDYQREKGIVSIDESLDVELAQLSQLSQQLVIAQAALFDQKARQEAVLRGGVKNLDSAVLADPIIRDLKVLLSRAEVKLSEVALRLNKQHPEYRAVQSEVQSLQSKLSSEFRYAKDRIKSDVAIALQKVAELKTAVDAKKQALLAINDNRNLLDVYMREVEDAKQILSLAVQRLAQIKLESESSESDVSMLSPAVAPVEASRPNLMVNFILSLFLGSVLAVIVALLSELLNRRVRNAKDIVLNVELPVLGEIKSSKRVARLKTSSLFVKNKLSFRS